MDLFGMIGSFLSGLFGYAGARDTNDTNLQVARETNAQNYKIWQEEKQHNVDMYNMQVEDAWEMYNQQLADSRETWKMQTDYQNEYNDISNQIARAEAAGLHPLSVLKGAGTTTGNAPSSNPGMQQPAVAPSHPPTMQSPSYVSPLTAALGSFTQSITALSAAQKNIADAGLAGSQTDKTAAETAGIKEQNRWYPHFAYEDWVAKNRANTLADLSFWNDYESSVIGLASQKATYSSMLMSNEAQEFALQWIGADKMIWLQAQADIHYNAVKRGQLTEKEAEAKVSEVARNYAEANYKGTISKQIEQEMKIREATGNLEVLKSQLEAAGLPTLENLSTLSVSQLSQIANEMGIEIGQPGGGTVANQLYDGIAKSMIMGNVISDYYSVYSRGAAKGAAYYENDYHKRFNKVLTNSLGTPTPFVTRANNLLDYSKDFIPFANPRRNNYYNNSVIYDDRY